MIEDQDYIKTLGKMAKERAITDMTWEKMAERVIKAII